MTRLDSVALAFSCSRSVAMEKSRKKEELSPLLDSDHRKSFNDSWIHNVTVEPVAFMHSFGWSLSGEIIRFWAYWNG